MHLITRIRIAGVAVLVCLLLCLAFVGTASAATVNPHLKVNRTHAVTNSSGCASFKFSGSGYTESTGTNTNHAVLSVDDTPFFDEDATFGSGSNSTTVVVNSEGRFTATLLICDAFVTAPDHWTVSSFDEFTGLNSNSVNLSVD